MRAAAKELPDIFTTVRRESQKLDGLSVRSKITLGYFLAMGIPTIGALSGLIIGNYYQKDSIQELNAIYQDQSLLHRLESNVARTRLAQELGPHVSSSEDFRAACEKIQKRLEEIEQLSLQLESSQSRAAAVLIPELQQYRITLDRFSKELDIMIATRQSELLSSARTEQHILIIARSQIFREFGQFADRVSTVLHDMDGEIVSAQLNLERAEQLRSQIIIGSVIASVVVSGILAIITIQTISRPLESLTKVAQAVSRNDDTDIRADVLTKDEIGLLAIALNQLIDWVNTYTSDLRTAQLQLIQAEKMSSVGQLIAGIAHEINNPVNFIHGNIRPVEQYVQDLIGVIQAYQSHYPHPPETLQDLLEETDIDFVQQDLPKTISSMKIGTSRIREIILSLRNFSRLDEAGSKRVDIHEGLDNTLLILEHRLDMQQKSSGIKVVRKYSSLPLVECFPGQINQVFMNLLANAIDILEAADSQAEKTISITTRPAGNQRIAIEIADTGSGMTAEVRSRIFDPFFTTKPIGKGTGLGLSISYQIITGQHGGTMRCASELGKGTKFTIEIPLTL